MTCGNHLRRDMFIEARNAAPIATMFTTNISETANSDGKIVGYPGSDCVNMKIAFFNESPRIYWGSKSEIFGLNDVSSLQFFRKSA